MRKDINISESSSFTVYEADVTPKNSVVHAHNNYELNYAKSGWGKKFVGDYFSSYEAGDLVLLGPNLPHSWESNIINGATNSRNIAIRFSENFMNGNLMRTPELKPALKLFEESSQGIQFTGPLVKKVEFHLEKLLAEKGIKSISRLLKIVDLLTKISEKKYLSTAGYMEQYSQSDFQRINLIYEYVFVNFQKQIKLKDVSDKVHMTPGSLCRFLKDKTNKTLFEIVKKVRIAYSCKLLVNTSKKISNIALESGYSSTVHFYKQFRELKGTSPMEYRKSKHLHLE